MEEGERGVREEEGRERQRRTKWRGERKVE